jgi:uncharacterized tellurite resistance protein B-like protein
MVLRSIRQFFTSHLEETGAERGPDPVAVAACALLLEVAHADGLFGEAERRRIVRAVAEMGVPEEEVREVVRLAEEERRESVDLYQFTRLVRERFTGEQRLRLLEAVWGIVYSDGALSAVENQLARRVAELLGFQQPEVQAVRERVKGRASS